MAGHGNELATNIPTAEYPFRQWYSSAFAGTRDRPAAQRETSISYLHVAKFLFYTHRNVIVTFHCDHYEPRYTVSASIR
jgi:hypothetical protein